MTEGDEERPGTVGRARDRLLETVELRLELFGLELREEKDRLFAILFGAMAAALSLFMAFFSLNLLLVVALWEQRVLTAAVLLAVYLPGAILIGLWIRHRIRQASVPFAESLRQLREDREMFRSGP